MNQPEYEYPTYRRPVTATWWLRNRRYFLFMMRELSSVFVALFALLYLYEFFLLSKGPAVHGAFQQSLRSGKFIAFYAVALLFAVYHTCTWFGVMGRIQVVRLGKVQVPPALVTAGAFAGWIAASALVGYFFMG
jgi:fumarate reductase subunit C